MINKRFPKYPDDADYNTNATSYYDDLARKQKLIQLLAEKIWQYDERLDERLEDLENVLQDYLSQWDVRIENLDIDASQLFVEWLNNGTLEQIINHDVLGNKADQSELDKIAIDPQFKSTSRTEDVQLGDELLNGSGWTSTGWTGDFSSGFKHIQGNTTPLVKTIPEGSVTSIFQIEMTVTDAGALIGGTSDFFVTIGGSEPFETYKGTFASTTYTFGIRSPKLNNLLTITPHSDFTGTISNISVKEITLFTTPKIQVRDSENQLSLQIRTGKAPLKNIFIGENGGRMNTTGEQNVSLGNGSLDFNTTGFWNVAMGHEAMKDNTVGTRNVALGRIALGQNISGDRNVAIGSWALTRNKTGRANIGIGADAHYYNETGSNNVAIGLVAMGGNTNGDNHIAIGERTMSGSNGGSGNIALGKLSLYYATSANNIAMGDQSHYQNRNGSDNVSMGYQSMMLNREGNYNIAIGRLSLRNIVEASNNIALGYQSQMKNVSGQHNISLGYQSLSENLEGHYNIAFGRLALSSSANTKESIGIGLSALELAKNNDRNIAIGSRTLRYIDGQRNVGLGTDVGSRIDAKGNFNTFLGSNTASNHLDGDNNIIIGYNIYKRLANASNEINIGDTIFGNSETKVVELAKLKLTDLPTTKPTESGVIWNDNGTLKIS